jgi:hypothetical protein
MRIGLDRIGDAGLDGYADPGARVGVCADSGAADSGGRTVAQVFSGAGVAVDRWIAPALAARRGEPARAAVAAALTGLELLVVDLIDDGTLGGRAPLALRTLLGAAGEVGVPVVVLDRPNPVDGATLAGPLVAGHVLGREVESPRWAGPVVGGPPVGTGALPFRHGFTLGELAGYGHAALGLSTKLDVALCEGWAREEEPDPDDALALRLETTLRIAATTNLRPAWSAPAGATDRALRVGIDDADAEAWVGACRAAALDNGLGWVDFAPVSWETPRGPVGGAAVRTLEPWALEGVLLGLVFIEAALRFDPGKLAWRHGRAGWELDLLLGTPEARVGLRSCLRPRELTDTWAAATARWAAAERKGWLTY